MLSKVLNFKYHPHYARKIWWKSITFRQFKKTGVQLGENVQILGRHLVSVEPDSQILIGAHCILCFDWLVLVSITGISGATICVAIETNIGSYVLLEVNATIVDTDFHSLKAKVRRYNNPYDIAASPVNIAVIVLIGAVDFILKGINIGAKSIIGVDAIIVHDISDNAIVAGNPAKKNYR